MTELLGVLAVLLAAAPAQAQKDAFQWLANLSVLQLPQAELQRRGIVTRPLGTIALPSGRIVAVDPYTAWGLVPLARRVPPGGYKVHLWFDAAEPTRPALAELRVRACTPVFWQNAAPEGRSVAELPPGEAYGYGVDAGAGSFAPPEFFETFGKIADGTVTGEAYGAFANGELMARAFPDASGIPQDFVVTRAGLSMAVFSSGWGDGWYASYWGFDQSGCLCALVTDFGVLDGGYPYESPLRTPGHGARAAPDTTGWGGDCPRPGT